LTGSENLIRSMEDLLRALLRDDIGAQPRLQIATAVIGASEPERFAADERDSFSLNLSESLFGNRFFSSPAVDGWEEERQIISARFTGLAAA